jgi:hypothetical protein
MVLAVALALVADRALAAEPQMPEDFQGTWCLNGDLSNEPTLTVIPCSETQAEVEVAATKVNIPDIPMSCIVRQVTKIDVCPWGMIFKNRERARTLRSFQINPWGPGYHIVLQCTSKRSETIRINWVMEKGYIRDVPRDYRCPWDRRGARLR